MRKMLKRLRFAVMGSDKADARKFFMFSVLGYSLTGFLFSGFVMTLVTAFRNGGGIEAFYLPAALSVAMSAVASMHLYIDELYRNWCIARRLNNCFIDPVLDLTITTGADLILETDPTVAAVSVEIPNRVVAAKASVS